ncbi:ExbD/TolR family protein [Rufibacter hautae]|uniref:Biopolymer transporter ExbD n=1 Tax=Rufibacter hautae TaxID=2595005 RepID=A0A5B6TFU7_9BACT|nr:biopolymer transporter ExbD [Rufibacter hautae]KAA3438102.1 biopolymer transporter ExbD [Rufibacter hautae]
MKLRQKRHSTSHVETGAMNDIMFFLLLFFLIASTMANPNAVKLLLPSAKSSKEVAQDPINISVTSAGEYFINKRPVAPENLEMELAKELTGTNIEKATVVLRVDASLNVQKLVDILEVGSKLKVKMIMATQSPSAAS